MAGGDLLICNSSYIPTSDEYFAALGSLSSTILIIGGLITLGLFILFFEQVVYTNQTAHRGAKRNIYWIASVFPMMTLMSLVALVIPRASTVCLSVKMVYMYIGISHFTDLTMVMFGGEELLLVRGREDAFNLRLGPICCCCRCLPNPPVTKYSLRLIILMTDQLPFAQATYYVTMMILLAADNITLGDVQPSGAFLWLNLFNIISAMFGVYGFMILSRFSKGYLNDFEYWRKSRSIRLLLLITSFQSSIFNIMANYGAFPCQPPYITPTVYKQTVDNSLYMLEMMVLGPYTYWQYHDQRFSTPITDLPSCNRSHSNSITSSTKHSTADTISTIVTAEISDSSDDEDSRERSNSINSNNSRKLNVVDIENETEGAAASQVNSRNSRNRRSRSRKGTSSERSSGFASNDSTRESASSRSKVRKISVNTTRTLSRENSTANSSYSINSSREDSARAIRDQTSKCDKKKSTPATSQGTSRENCASASRDSTRERSISPSNTNSSVRSDSPTHTTSTAAPCLLQHAHSLASHSTKGKAEYINF